MRYEIKLTEHVQTWNWVDGHSVPVTGTKVALIVPAYSGYDTIFDRVARTDAELREAIALAHRYGAEWKQAHPSTPALQTQEDDDGADQSDYAPMGNLNALRAALQEGR